MMVLYDRLCILKRIIQRSSIIKEMINYITFFDFFLVVVV